jgi:two-component system, chemotaxis family, CheB/CheR fusion protein
MTGTAQTFTKPPNYGADNAITLALRLAHAETTLEAFTSGQVDAIVDPFGRTYLLRPAQEHLRRNEARLQVLFDSVPDVITVLNEAGEVLHQSPAVTRVLGYDAGELVGRSVLEFVHPHDLPGFERAFSEVIENVRPTTPAEFRHRARDGSWCPLEATLGSLQLSETAGVILTFRDASYRRLTQEESARREAAYAHDALARDRLLAMLSHELRTPLTPALLGIYELQEDERFAEARPTLKMIQRNIELQIRLLEELVAFTAVGHHKVPIRSESIDAHEAIRFVLEICQSEIAAAQIEVLLDLRASENVVLADSVRLQQVMWNLLKNAVKFSPPGSSISIATVNDAPGRLTIEFADHGIGIEPALLPLVFDSFQQGDISGQQGKGGLGLGLFIAKGLAEAQGGTLTAFSEGRGRGATFRLTLNTQAARARLGQTDEVTHHENTIESLIRDGP